MKETHKKLLYTLGVSTIVLSPVSRLPVAVGCYRGTPVQAGQAEREE